MNTIKNIIRPRRGLQTIAWGASIEDFEDLCKRAKDLEYEGLEFAQSPFALSNYATIQEALQRHSLELIGLAGGSLSARMSFLKMSGLHPNYLYVDERDTVGMQQAIAEGETLGLHPHYRKDISTIARAEAVRAIDPGHIRYILDTAHLFLSKDFIDSNHVLSQLRRVGHDVVALHLKDWRSQYGRSPFRFARGFCALGDGELDEILEATVNWIVDSQFSGWIIIEQDGCQGDPWKAAQQSRKWLQNHGL